MDSVFASAVHEAGLGAGVAGPCTGNNDRLLGRRNGEIDCDPLGCLPLLTDALIRLVVELVISLDEDRGRQLEPNVVCVDQDSQIVVVSVAVVFEELVNGGEPALDLGDTAASEVPPRPVELALPVEEDGHRVAESHCGHDGLAQVDVRRLGGHEDAHASGAANFARFRNGKHHKLITGDRVIPGR